MALSLDDRLLGEKVHNYCSSSEDEGEDDQDNPASDEEWSGSAIKDPTFIPEAELRESDGRVTNTGPKGVIQDWREYKRLETEKREEQERERDALAKKLTLTCRSHLDDQKEKEKDDLFMAELEAQLGDLEDDFLREYREKRIEEMRRAFESVPKFGVVASINKEEFLEAIDKEKPIVTVIVHIYENRKPGCDAMNKCINTLAEEYPTVKFCRIRATEAKLSHRFSADGVPALLIYKAGELIGNFIRLSDEFGNEFVASDVEGFLLEHGFLPDKNCVTSAVHTSTIKQSRPTEDSDSDLD